MRKLELELIDVIEIPLIAVIIIAVIGIISPGILTASIEIANVSNALGICLAWTMLLMFSLLVKILCSELWTMVKRHCGLFQKVGEAGCEKKVEKN